MSKDDAWIDDVRSGRVKEAIDYLREELQTPRIVWTPPNNIFIPDCHRRHRWGRREQ
jgi:hypothetical protein